MILNDTGIRFWMGQPAGIEIDPVPEDDCFQPASVDLTLGSHFIRYVKHAGLNIIDIREPSTVTKAKEEFDVSEDDGVILDPGDFILGVTRERLTVPSTMVARVEGKSTLGRLGILVHATAGFIDPGFRGRITLELKNVGSLAVRLWPGQKISQVAFEMMAEASHRAYGAAGLESRYQHSNDVMEAQVAGLMRKRRREHAKVSGR